MFVVVQYLVLLWYTVLHSASCPLPNPTAWGLQRKPSVTQKPVLYNRIGFLGGGGYPQKHDLVAN